MCKKHTKKNLQRVQTHILWINNDYLRRAEHT